jgi:hypothetical protein
MVSAVGLMALVLSALPDNSLAEIMARFMRPTATPHYVTQSSSQLSITTPGADEATPAATSDLRAQPLGMLAPAPTTCGATKPTQLEQAGPPAFAGAIGKAPVWLVGFTTSNATARLGSSAGSSWGAWSAPYTGYGWPAPMIIVTQQRFTQPVTLYGFNLLTYEPVSFGLVLAGQWGEPQDVASGYLLNPQRSDIPAGGEDQAGDFWYGYMFFPQAGCYQITATWPGGSWSFVVSAGR